MADRLKRPLMEAALAEFVTLHASTRTFLEADWTKVRGLEFREALGKRDELTAKLDFSTAEQVDFEESVSFLFRSFHYYLLTESCAVSNSSR